MVSVLIILKDNDKFCMVIINQNTVKISWSLFPGSQGLINIPLSCRSRNESWSVMISWLSDKCKSDNTPMITHNWLQIINYYAIYSFAHIQLNKIQISIIHKWMLHLPHGIGLSVACGRTQHFAEAVLSNQVKFAYWFSQSHIFHWSSYFFHRLTHGTRTSKLHSLIMPLQN